MIDVLDERAETIRLEPPGDEGEGVEFWLRREGLLEFHQVKRQHSKNGRWSLRDLASENVLSHFLDKLVGTTASCVFVSMDSASELRELADRARQAASWEEFSREFIGNLKWGKAFNTLCAEWNTKSGAEVFHLLKSLWVRTADEDYLRTTTESHISALAEGDPRNVCDVLAQLALTDLHQELSAFDLWQNLEAHGYRRRQWGNNSHVLTAVQNVMDRYLRAPFRPTIGGRVINRYEAQDIIHKLTGSGNRLGLLVTGEAGIGKTCVILQVLEGLGKLGWPSLAFRMDRLEPTQLPDEIGKQLGLPGSPVTVLASIAQGRECVLVIDQLDAVSLASGRNPSFFDCIDVMIKQAQAHPQMRLILSCRKFDLNNDHRFQHLVGDQGIADTVSIGQLSSAIVQDILLTLGVSEKRLSGKQLDLLSVPLHMSLFAELLQHSSDDVFGFRTGADLFERFWSYKEKATSLRLGRSVQWTKVIDSLCEYMSNRQTLSAPVVNVDEYRDDARAMASEHVIVQDGGRYAFFHEGFFDYAFARRFAGRGLALLSLLASNEQHLFRRSQVRQILFLERSVDSDRYLDDLRQLLTNVGVRFHLKQVVFDILAQLNDPTEAEWNVMAPLFNDHNDPHSWHAWRVLHISRHWFQLLISLGVLARWLGGRDERLIDNTVRLLSSVQKQMPDEVTALVAPYLGVSEAWRSRLMFLMQWADLGISRRFFDLFLGLIDDGTLDNAKGPIAVNADFWDLLRYLPRQHPDWACEAIGRYLNRRLALSIANGQSNPFAEDSTSFANGRGYHSVFSDSARKAPAVFVANVLPFMLKIIELNAEQDRDPPWPDPVWRYRFFGGGYGIDDALLATMETALSLLATDEPEGFVIIADGLSRLRFETVQYLLVRAYAANGPRFANDAVDYLCDRPGRLRTGYVSDSHWATRRLLEAITPYCTNERLERLEEVMLGYYSEFEKTTTKRYSWGKAQFTLLEGIAPSRRSERVARRLGEWQRKFSSSPTTAPKKREAQEVGSPVPELAAERMTDEQWMKAIAHYSSDDMRTSRNGSLVGGAQELASSLEKQARQHPARFANLACVIPDDTHPAYFHAVLRGIQGTARDPEVVLPVCERCHRLPNRPCGREICDCIAALADQGLPTEALDMVSWYATEDPDPRQEMWRTETVNGEPYYGGDILTAGINSVRGHGAEAVGRLVYENRSRLAYLESTLDTMVQDHSVAVRACVFKALIGVLNHDRTRAIQLFLRLCETEDSLLGTAYAERFLKYSLNTHFETLTPVLEHMIGSGLATVSEAGARLACLASLDFEAARPLAGRCLAGEEFQRVGAAQVFAANLRLAQFRAFCEESLVRLFADSSEKVRSEAARCFSHLGENEIGNYGQLIEQFTPSPAFATNYDPLIHALDRTTTKLPDVTYDVCTRFLDNAGSKVADISYREAGEADVVVRLVMRVYNQSSDSAVRSRSLDLIDRLIQIGAFGIDKALTEYER